MQTFYISNEKRTRLMAYLLANPNEPIEIRKIASKLKLNPGFVSVFIKKLRKEHLVKNSFIDINSSIVRVWKILFNIEEVSRIIRDIVKTIKPIGIGLYGSWIKGTNNEKSDLDLWIKIKDYPEDIKIARLRSTLRKKVGAEPSLLFVNEEKLKNMKKDNPSLYFSLINSFYLWGENID